MKIVYTIKDAKGKTSNLTFNYPDVDLITGVTNSLTDPTVGAYDLATTFEGLLTGAIVGCNIIIPVDMSNVGKSTPLSNSDVEEGARFQFKTANGYFTSVRLPTFDENYIIAGSAEVDLTDPAVLRFVGEVTDATDSAHINGLTDARGDDITMLHDAREDFKRS